MSIDMSNDMISPDPDPNLDLDLDPDPDTSEQTFVLWTNKLGETMGSRVHASFEQGVSTYYVVHNWREGTRGHGFIVLEKKDIKAVFTDPEVYKKVFGG